MRVRGRVGPYHISRDGPGMRLASLPPPSAATVQAAIDALSARIDTLESCGLFKEADAERERLRAIRAAAARNGSKTS